MVEFKVQVGPLACSSHGADCAVVVVAAGSGERFKHMCGKALAPLAGMPLFSWAVTTADVCASTAQVVVVVSAQDFEDCVQTLKGLELMVPVTVVTGGDTRQKSVYKGLQATDAKLPLVAIQDGARPLTPSSVFELVAAELRKDKMLAGAIAGRPTTDTIKLLTEDGDISQTPNRRRFFSAETPQTFRRSAILKAHKLAQEEGFVGTDDASLVEHYGGRVKTVAIEACNVKVTYPDDLLVAEAVLIEKSRREIEFNKFFKDEL